MVLDTKKLRSLINMKLLWAVVFLLILNILFWIRVTLINYNQPQAVMLAFEGEEILSPRDSAVFASLWGHKLAWSFSGVTNSTIGEVSSLGTLSASTYLDGYEKAADICQRIFSRYKFRTISPAGSSDSCKSALSRAIPVVSCEIFRSFATFSSNRSDDQYVQRECQPQNYTFPCHLLNQSTLQCNSPPVVQSFDYHKQHHCLSLLVDQLIVDSNSNSLDKNKTGRESRNSNTTVPRILHYIWFYNNKMDFDFIFYLGMISTLRFFQPKAIFLWHDGVLPNGRWWHEFVKQLYPPKSGVTNITVNASIGGKQFQRFVEFFGDTKLYFIYRRRPADIYGNKITNDAHKSDIVRMEALIHYGGLYIDTDVLTLRTLDQFVQYSVTMPKEPMNSISNSIIFAERYAPYLFLWHHTYTTFKSKEWGEHSTSGNYQLSISCPFYVHQESDALMKPSNLVHLYVTDVSLTSKYMFHLYWNWEKLYAPKGSFREAHDPAEIMDWKCTMGRIMRSIFLGTCSEFCG